MTYEVVVDGKVRKLVLLRRESGFACSLDGREVAVDAEMVSPDVMSLVMGEDGGRSFEVKRESVNGETFLWVGRARYAVEVRDPRARRTARWRRRPSRSCNRSRRAPSDTRRCTACQRTSA